MRSLTQLCKPTVPPLDHFDHAILAILQGDNRTPLRTIGERVHLSAPAVQRRIKAMEEAGVIAANTALVDPARVGMALTIITEVYIESERLDLLDAIKAAFLAAPEVQQCYYVTGDADFVLMILVATMADYDALSRRLFAGNPNVKRFRTLVALDRIKTGSGVPLPGLSHS